MRMKLILAAGLGLMTAGLAASFAQTGNARDISGAWKFKTVLARKGCVIEGDITFTRASGANYRCSFVAQETCGMRFQRVKQSCTAMQVSGTVVIASRVDEIVDAGPAEVRDLLLQPGTYKADNFVLNKISGAEMTGSFYSNNTAPVRFWRDVDLVS
jgi:hypothetical protein